MPAIAPAAKFATKGRASSRYQSHDNTKLWDYYNLRLGLCSWAILIGIQQSTDKSMKRNQCQWSCQCQLERSLRRGLHIGVLWRQGGHKVTVSCVTRFYGNTVTVHLCCDTDCRLDELVWSTFTPGKSSRMRQRRFTQNHRMMFVLSLLKKKNLISHLFYRHGIV